MKVALTADQVSKIVEILTQYAPEGWTALKMHLVTDEAHTEVSTWAETNANPEHGFVLDDGDRATLDELIDAAWKSSSCSWNSLDFSVTADGEYELSAS